MKAAICLEQDQPLSVEEVTPLDPGPTDVIVRITASGVCHSDLSVINGTLPAGKVVLGHEGTGVVEKVGADVNRVHVGDRVIGSFIPACGVCWYCLHDQSNLCAETYSVMFVPRVRRENGEDIQAMTGLGTFAEMMTVSQHSVVKVESDLPDEQLALIGCGVTTGVGAALNTARVEPGSIVAVIGCGGVGQAVIQGARIAGAARDHRHRSGGDEAGRRAAVRRHRRRRSGRRRPHRGSARPQRWARGGLRLRGDRHRGHHPPGHRDRAPGRHRGDGGRAEARHRRPDPGDVGARGEDDPRLRLRVRTCAARLPAA